MNQKRKNKRFDLFSWLVVLPLTIIQICALYMVCTNEAYHGKMVFWIIGLILSIVMVLMMASIAYSKRENGYYNDFDEVRKRRKKRITLKALFVIQCAILLLMLFGGTAFFKILMLFGGTAFFKKSPL